MSDTLVIQSHRQPLPSPWLKACLDSVRVWSENNHYTYRFMDDALFNSLPEELSGRLQGQIVIATDLARLYALQSALQEGFTTVVWLDADFLIFDPERFVLPESDYAVGREVWVQENEGGRLKVYKKVHNAILMFRQGNSLLDFYADTALRLLELNQGPMPPQFIGPKLLTALHNIAKFPVMETAGMLCPLVIRDINKQGGPALDLFCQNSDMTIAGANLCLSSLQKAELTESDFQQLIDRLLNQTGPCTG